VVILLSGPPGTGKTFAAEAIAGELERPLLRACLPELLSKWMGETEQRLAGLFAAARKKKAVLLLDEVDGLLASRGSGQHHDDRLVNLLLMELESTKGFVILTTNRGEVLDEALARRVTVHLVLERPARAERIEIWMRFLPKKAPYAGNLNLEELADLPLSGAEIRKACQEAARRVASRPPEARQIRQQDLSMRRA
jgi:SpoVK/Ycf46/Vps4 family AAA+-type ATPase